MMNNLAAIIDVDGTISDFNHRKEFALAKDWYAFQQLCHLDKPIVPVIQVVRGLWAQGWLIFVVTGRNQEYREITKEWLVKHGLPFSKLITRTQDDIGVRDVDFKRRALDELTRNYPAHQFALAIEDRDELVEMWRGEGLICLQAQKGVY
jgi:uncharacterized HAD superfamily protein